MEKKASNCSEDTDAIVLKKGTWKRVETILKNPKTKWIVILCVSISIGATILFLSKGIQFQKNLSALERFEIPNSIAFLKIDAWLSVTYSSLFQNNLSVLEALVMPYLTYLTGFLKIDTWLSITNSFLKTFIANLIISLVIIFILLFVNKEIRGSRKAKSAVVIASFFSVLLTLTLFVNGIQYGNNPCTVDYSEFSVLQELSQDGFQFVDIFFINAFINVVLSVVPFINGNNQCVDYFGFPILKEFYEMNFWLLDFISFSVTFSANFIIFVATIPAAELGGKR